MPTYPQMPYAPPTYYGNRGGENIASLLARQGDIAAQGALRSGEAWSRATEQLGQIAAGAYQQHQQEKQTKKREALFTQAVTSWDDNDPKGSVMRLAQVVGPQDAIKFGQGLMEFRKPEMTPEGLQATIHSAAVLYKNAPELFAQSYPMIRQKLGPALQAQGITLPEQPDESVTKYLEAMGNPQKAPGTKTVEVRNPDGTVTTKIVEDRAGQEFTSAAPPAKPAEAPPTKDIGGRVKQWNPASGRFDIDLGASEGSLNRAAAADNRATVAARRTQEQADAKSANDSQVKSAFAALKTALDNVKAYSGSAAITSPLEAANARQQYKAAASAFAATLSRATGDTRISDNDRKAYAGLVTYTGPGSSLLMVARPDLAEKRLSEAERFFESASAARKGDEPAGPPAGMSGSGTASDPYRFE